MRPASVPRRGAAGQQCSVKARKYSSEGCLKSVRAVACARPAMIELVELRLCLASQEFLLRLASFKALISGRKELV